jgi:hypothetical protein
LELYKCGEEPKFIFGRRDLARLFALIQNFIKAPSVGKNSPLGKLEYNTYSETFEFQKAGLNLITENLFTIALHMQNIDSMFEILNERIENKNNRVEGYLVSIRAVIEACSLIEWFTSDIETNTILRKCYGICEKNESEQRSFDCEVVNMDQGLDDLIRVNGDFTLDKDKTEFFHSSFLKIVKANASKDSYLNSSANLPADLKKLSIRVPNQLKLMQISKLGPILVPVYRLLSNIAHNRSWSRQHISIYKFIQQDTNTRGKHERYVDTDMYFYFISLMLFYVEYVFMRARSFCDDVENAEARSEVQL